MTPMKILATTDGSPRSRAVIPHAARLAQAVDGELLLLRVLSPELARLRRRAYSHHP